MQTIDINDTATTMVGKLNQNFTEAGGTTQVVATDSNVQNVFLGHMEQNGNWVRQKDIVCPVEYGITYSFTLPDDIVAKVEYGTSASLGSTSSNIINGGTFTFPQSALAQRISFARLNDGVVTQLTKADCDTMISDGSINITFNTSSTNTPRSSTRPPTRLAVMANPADPKPRAGP